MQLGKPQNKSLHDMYIPTSSYGFKNGKPYHLYDSKKNLPFEFAKDFRKGKVTQIKLIEEKEANYKLLLNNPNFIQLDYPDQITFSLFLNKHFKHGNREFNRIFVPQSSNKWLYLGNDRNNYVYRLRIKNASFDRLRRYAQNAKYKDEIQFTRFKSGYSVFYNETTNWRVYSYLTSHQNNSYFVARLLGTSGVSSRTNKRGQTTYSLNYSARLRVPRSTQNDYNYLYTRFDKNKKLTSSQRLLNSVYYVHRLGLIEQNLRFFDADKDNIVYTNYIEGIPVFLNDHSPQVSGNYSGSAVSVAFNSTDFQIPIPFDGRTRNLISTHQLINNLAKHGLHEDNIDKIIIGFHVEKDNSHNSLVNLLPCYYVKAYGTWKSADEWEKQNNNLYQMNSNNEGVD